MCWVCAKLQFAVVDCREKLNVTMVMPFLVGFILYLVLEVRITEIEAVVYKKQMKHNDSGQTGGHMHGRQAELMNGWSEGEQTKRIQLLVLTEETGNMGMCLRNHKF